MPASAASGSVPYWSVVHTDVVVRQLDDDFAVYDRATGYTHLLSIVAGSVLAHLLRAGRPLAAPELTRLLMDDLLVGEGEPLPDMSQLLESLSEAGLVRPVSA